MIESALHTEPLTASRTALDTLASMPLDDLRRLAARLDDETRIVRGILRERCRRPDRARLQLVGEPTA